MFPFPDANFASTICEFQFITYSLTLIWLVFGCNLLFVAEKRISFDEYLPLLKDTAKNKDKTLNQSDFIEAFKVFDKEQNGHISTAELRHLLTNLGTYCIFVSLSVQIIKIHVSL